VAVIFGQQLTEWQSREHSSAFPDGAPKKNNNNNNVKTMVPQENSIKIQNHNLNFFFFPLWFCSPARAMASSFHEVFDHTQRRTTFGRTPLDE
jgi:hypothetical protein